LSYHRDGFTDQTTGSNPVGSVDFIDDALLNAWDQLLTVATLYDADNMRFQGTVSDWRRALASIHAGETVEIEVGGGDRLCHCGREHSPRSVSRSRFYPLLFAVGIETLRMPRDIDAETLHRFLTLLRENGKQAMGLGGLRRADLSDLPAEIDLRLRDFSRAPDMHESGEVATDLDPTSAPPTRMTDEDLERSTCRLSAIELSDSFVEVDGWQAQEPSSGDDAAQLQSFLDGADAPFDPRDPDHGMWLGFLLQCFLVEDDRTDPEVLDREIARLLDGKIDLRKSQILLSALEGFIVNSEIEAVDRLLPRLLGLLRQDPRAQMRVLAELLAGVDSSGLEKLWPHAADLVLRGGPELLDELFRVGRGVCLDLPSELGERVLPRFESCPSLIEGWFEPDLFRPLRRGMTSICLMLLRSVRAEAVGNLLHRALLDRPVAEPHASILKLQGGFRQSCRDYYRLLLEIEGTPQLAPLLAVEAAEQARRELGRLPRNERGRSEVTQAIAALAPASEGPADELLDTIQHERRKGLLPGWPAEARREAARVAADRPWTMREGGES